jgi:phospholipid-binding lipoprotein MlaA
MMKKSTFVFIWFLTVGLALSVGCSHSKQSGDKPVSSAENQQRTTPMIAPTANGPLVADKATTSTQSAAAQESAALLKDVAGDYDNAEELALADPLYYWNWCWFKFNDKFYFVLLKPVSTGWGYLVYPHCARQGVHNFIENIGFPGRFLNCGLQGRFKGSGVEILRFLTNTTIGVAGFWDAGDDLFDMKPHEADFDQTLGKWHVGQGIYLVWPLLGPSSLRGSVGTVADSELNYFYNLWYVTALRTVNDTSLELNPYESLLQMTVDPYTAIRNAYVQNRKQRVEGE